MDSGYTSGKGRGCLLDSSDTKILIGIPSWSGFICTNTICSYIDAIQYNALKHPTHKIDVEFRVRQFTTYAAERLCEHAAEKYDYLLFWGDDIVAPHDCIERLLAHRKDIVAATVCGRGAPFAIYAKGEDGKNFHRNDIGNGLKKALGCGTGLMLIRTDVFKRMNKPLWAWPNDETKDVDMVFCTRAREEGLAEIYVDTNMVVQHLNFTPNVVDVGTHEIYMKHLKESGMLDSDKVREHKDYKLIEDLL